MLNGAVPALRSPTGGSIPSRRQRCQPRQTKRYFQNAPAAVRASAAAATAATSDGFLHRVDAGAGARAGAGAVPLQASALRWSGGGGGCGGGVGGVGLRKRVPRRVGNHRHSYNAGDGGATGLGNLEAGPCLSIIFSWL